jgi:cytochrome c oxidase subunit 3
VAALGSIGALLMAIRWHRLDAGDSGQRILPARHPAVQSWLFFIGLLVVLYTMFGWWGDTIKEAHQGHHTRSSRCTCATA